MSKKFRCGRLLLMRDGHLKKLDLGSGGGTRTCEWPNDLMTFDDVHQQLLNVFSFSKRVFDRRIVSSQSRLVLADKKQQTSLYDFQHQPLDCKQFATFADYVNKYGLNRNSTVVYLCASETDIATPTSVVKTRTPVVSLPVVPKEVKPEPEETQPAEPQPTSSGNSLSIIAILSDVRALEFSFVDVSNELMKNARELISQNPKDRVLNKLFRKICLIHGYVFSVFLPLQQQKHDDPASESEAKPHPYNLTGVFNTVDVTKALLHRHTERFRHLQLFSTICRLFFQFHRHVQVGGSISFLVGSMQRRFFVDSSQSMDEQRATRQHAEYDITFLHTKFEKKPTSLNTKEVVWSERQSQSRRFQTRTFAHIILV